MINDSLSPVPYFEMMIKEVEGKTIIILVVKKGKDTPYYYKGKASSEDLNFSILEARLQKEAGIERLNLDILKTLNLYHKDGYYNTVGELLSDEML